MLRLRTRTLDLSVPRVMGVLNVTPDSFSDGGRYLDPAAAIARGREMAEQGAAIIDVGGESTRPGADPVGEAEEMARVLPVIEALAKDPGCPVSIDTRKPAVMKAACAVGAELINDVGALSADGALAAAHETGAGVCLMHMRGEPRTMQEQPQYDDVLDEVRRFLDARLAACRRAGIAAERMLVDPGIGFGKSLEHNLRLLAGIPVLGSLGCPVVVGASRKSMFGRLLNREAGQRLPGSLAVAAVAVWQGAAIVRAHDVAATVDAVRVAHELRLRARERG